MIIFMKGFSMEQKWLKWSRRIQTIAQAGLTYSTNAYDLERYLELKNLSLEILSDYTKLDTEKLEELTIEEGYLTPKVDVRGVVFKDNKILMVKEKADQKWSIPGGWADIGLSPSEVVVKEIKEEAGYLVKPVRIIAVMDRKCHPHPPALFYAYKIILLCDLLGGEPKLNTEICDIDFFQRENLPELSQTRVTESQIKMFFEYLDKPDKETYFD